jgi:acrylyl-CoA reductase (NADPH)
MNATEFDCFLVEKDSAGNVHRGMSRCNVADLPAGEVLVRVDYSSLNYKDALACEAHPGVVRKLPHLPGIDAAGVVLESSDSRFKVNDAVVVTGNDLGSGQWGGWSEYIRVPASWVVPMPEGGLSLKDCMILGTAGFTAAQCVHAIVHNGVTPEAGEIVVTGATGGVGCLAVKLLAKLGYTVVAVTGKPQLESQLKSWGARRVISREEVLKPTDRPLLSARFAGAVDTVGGDTLTTIIRETKPYGVVSACGLVGGEKLNLTVHPFILRGVLLAGIGSAMLPYSQRVEIWRKLSQEWRLDKLDELATFVRLADVEPYVQRILKGQAIGRTVIAVRAGERALATST